MQAEQLETLVGTKTKFTELSKLGAGDFGHLTGSLEEHLIATHELLRLWGAGEDLQTAGLYHAAYGTAGFEEAMVNIDQRARIRSIIGEPAEQIAYVYCACDRAVVWPSIHGSQPVQFHNRFTGRTGPLEGLELRDFCELTVANEVQIATDNLDFVTQHGAALNDLFTRMDVNLSPDASTAWRAALQPQMK